MQRLYSRKRRIKKEFRIQNLEGFEKSFDENGDGLFISLEGWVETLQFNKPY